MWEKNNAESERQDTKLTSSHALGRGGPRELGGGER